MLPYIIVFIFTPLNTYLAEKYFKKNKKSIAIFFCIIAILIPSIIAGIRHISVGVDGEVYIEPYFNTYKSFSIFDVITQSSSFNLEILFGFILYLGSQISSNPNIVFFIIQLIITIVLFITAFKTRKKLNMTMFMTVFALVIFAKGLNIMRQTIGISFFILSLYYMFNDKRIKTITFFLIGLLFHSSVAILGIIYLLYYINKKTKNNKQRIIQIVLISSITMILAMNINRIILALAQNGIIPARYYNYIQNVEAVDFNFSWLMYNGLLMCLAFLIYKKTSHKNSHLENVQNFTLFESTFIGILLLISMLLIGNSGEIYRFSYSFMVIGIIYLFPQFYLALKKDKLNFFLGYILMYIILFMFFYLSFIFIKQAKIYPFIFM